MIGELKPYNEYKASELPWVGQMPRHWDTARAKSLFIKMDRAVRPEDEVVTCFRDGMVTLRKNRRLRGFTEATVYSGYQGIRKGDLVIHGMDAFAGAIGVSDSEGKSTPVYSVCQPRAGVSASYYAHLIREMSQSQWILALAKGIRERSTDFRFATFADQYVPVPPLAEQAAIVRFLEWANGRLERAIRAKRKVMALLMEQKQAVIDNAVARGAHSGAILKPCSISSLKRMPEGWAVWPFVRCSIERADYRGATPEKVDSGIFLVTAKNVRKGWIDYNASKEYVRPSDYSMIMRRGLPKKDDVLLTMEAPLGHVALIDREDVALAQRVIRFRLHPDRLLPQFALLCLNSAYFQSQIQARATGSTAQGIKASKLPQLLVACPPIEEQRKIVEQVGLKCAPLNRLISRFGREIDLLREYRTRLIADVVTGKLDVREAASRLPEEAATSIEAEPADEADDHELTDEEAEA